MKTLLKSLLGRPLRRDRPLYFFCHHKVGTVLLTRMMEKVSAVFGWSQRVVLGMPDEVPHADVVIFAHSLPDPASIDPPFVGAHFFRDPRDVIVSGYLYHRRCDEKWCVHEDLDPTDPITFPRVPHSQAHRPEAWKRSYLEGLGGRSYQQNLLSLSQDEGLQFEMDRYGGWTTEAMAKWEGDPRLVEVRFEDIMTDFDAQFRRIFQHAGLEGEALARAMALAATEDLSRKSDAQVEADAHVTSRATTRWRTFFGPWHKQGFKTRFPGVLQRLGYESGDDW